MIGDDDFESFYDPDEFGGVVTVHEQGKAPRDVPGIFGKPVARGGVFRAGIDPGAAQVRAAPDQLQFQMANSSVPKPFLSVKVVANGKAYLIADVEPLGRFRSLVTMTPDGGRAGSDSGELGKWAVLS
ncbi:MULTISPECIES: hypothetical protein [Pseudomonas syringae group]|nr:MULTISPECIES: hypothetical protein [Pseudomonas syringae group]RXU06995.1 hypothetical protein B1F68_10300 [Pseudomonas syringae]RXU07032.1 hypothetical protein B1F68_10505 [Pseudomonas syringae]